MPEPVSPLMLEFLTWVSSRHRGYDEATEAWHTTCPRHTVWEDAFIDGLVQIENGSAQDQCKVTLTPRGRAILEGNRGRKSSQTDPVSDV
jgi:hypothetical protein